MQKLIKLHPLDNVQILVADVEPQEYLIINGQATLIQEFIGIGHKIADQMISPGQKIIKYGVPIGSATAVIEIGRQVHLHNIKSDYIPTYTIEKEFKEKDS
jgi:(2R)-sulfolactate sulfo-lyase subunit alpha